MSKGKYSDIFFRYANENLLHMKCFFLFFFYIWRRWSAYANSPNVSDIKRSGADSDIINSGSCSESDKLNHRCPCLSVWKKIFITSRSSMELRFLKVLMFYCVLPDCNDKEKNDEIEKYESNIKCLREACTHVWFALMYMLKNVLSQYFNKLVKT